MKPSVHRFTPIYWQQTQTWRELGTTISLALSYSTSSSAHRLQLGPPLLLSTHWYSLGPLPPHIDDLVLDHYYIWPLHLRPQAAVGCCCSVFRFVADQIRCFPFSSSIQWFPVCCSSEYVGASEVAWNAAIKESSGLWKDSLWYVMQMFFVHVSWQWVGFPPVSFPRWMSLPSPALLSVSLLMDLTLFSWSKSWIWDESFRDHSF